jgi:hypothetical protein
LDSGTVTGNLGVGGAIATNSQMNLEGSFSLAEQAAADADTAAYGQLWVNTATPNELWFTNDAGTDVQLGVGGAPDWASPGTIGSTTPNTGAFTTLSSSGVSTLDSAVTTGDLTVGDDLTVSGARINVHGSSPDIRIADAGSTTSYLRLWDSSSGQARIEKHTATGNSTVNIDPHPDDGTSKASWNVFRYTNTTNSKEFNMFPGDGSGTAVHTLSPSGKSTWNAPGNDIDFVVEGDADPSLLYINAGTDRFGIGDSAPAAKLEVNQVSASAAIPVLQLTQADPDDSFTNYSGTSAGDGSASISSDTTEDSAKFGAIRIEINGATKWIRVYDDES